MNVIIYFCHHLPKMLRLGEDIISSHVVRTLPIGVLLNLLMTCKLLYALRKHCIANNNTYQSFGADKDGLLCKIMNSHINLQTFALQSNVHGSDIQRYYNTFSVLRITNTYGDIHTMQRYCINMLKDLYGYTIKISCENNILYHHFCNDDVWKCSNIPVFVYYEIVYHIANQKYRNLEYTLLNHVKFLSRKEHHFETLQLIMLFMTYQKNKHINAAMIYVIYEYIGFIIDELLLDYSKNSNLINCVIQKRADFHNDVMKMTGLPKYIKYTIVNKLWQVVSVITEKTETL